MALPEKTVPRLLSPALRIDRGDGQSRLLQHIQQDPNRIQGRKQRDVVFRGQKADHHSVGGLVQGIRIAGVDHVGDVALANCFGNLVAALVHFFEDMGADPVFLQEV